MQGDRIKFWCGFFVVAPMEKKFHSNFPSLAALWSRQFIEVIVANFEMKGLGV